jgi:hypothetical protein
MNRVKSTLVTSMRSLPIRGEDGRIAPRSIMVLVVVLFALVGIGATAQRNSAQKNQAKIANSADPAPRNEMLQIHRSLPYSFRA